MRQSAHRILSLVHSHIAVLHITFFSSAHRNVFLLHPKLFHVDKGCCSEIEKCCIKVFIVRWKSTKLPYAEPHVSLTRFLFLLILYKPFLLLKR